MSDQTARDTRLRKDSKALAAIGGRVGAQVGPITVRLPRRLAQAALAAWDRWELDGSGEETHEQHVLHDRAAELALIGLAIQRNGRWEGNEMIVDLDVASAGAAVRASSK
ncbi:hypothetical protein [Kitasatospora sp. NPDC097643]|uniref:hypothetical protein n=1 Tax=Kitasatospora sp. NPDC097643 TaxID=3157230 RepID=UPI00332EF1C7